MFCGYCGKQVIDGTAFCPYCGSQMEPVAPLPEEQYGQQYGQQPYSQYGQVYEQQYGQYEQQYAQNDPQYRQYDQQYAQYDQQYGYSAYAPAAAAGAGGAFVSDKGRKWPVACAVIGIIGLVMLIIGNLLPLAFDSFVGFNIFNAVIMVMMIVVFFIPTKRIAWVTIFPFLIYVGAEIYAQVRTIGQLREIYGSGWTVISEILYLAVPVILFALYVLTMAIRPEGSALKVLFLVFMILEIVLLLIASFSLIYSGVTYSSGSFILSPLFTRLAFVFFYIGHGVAVLSVFGR